MAPAEGYPKLIEIQTIVDCNKNVIFIPLIALADFN